MPNLKFQVSAMLVAFEFSHHCGMYGCGVLSAACPHCTLLVVSCIHNCVWGHSMAASPHCTLLVVSCIHNYVWGYSMAASPHCTLLVVSCIHNCVWGTAWQRVRTARYLWCHVFTTMYGGTAWQRVRTARYLWCHVFTTVYGGTAWQRVRTARYLWCHVFTTVYGAQHGSESALHATCGVMYSQLCMGHSMAASPHCTLLVVSCIHNYVWGTAWQRVRIVRHISISPFHAIGIDIVFLGIAKLM